MEAKSEDYRAKAIAMGWQGPISKAVKQSDIPYYQHTAQTIY